MSAKQAAESLITNDPSIAEQVRAIEEAGPYVDGRTEMIMTLLQEITSTWTLTLVANAAGVTEEQVIASLAGDGPLKIGTSLVARGIARTLYSERS